MNRIDAEVLIPGRGGPIRDATVVTDGGVITYVGPSSGAPDLPALKVPVVMPGLWECHGHFTGLSTLDMHETMRLPVAVAAARCLETRRSRARRRLHECA